MSTRHANSALLGTTLLLVGLLAAGGCRDPREDLKGGKLIFEDSFERAAAGPRWSVGVVEGPASKGGGPRNAADEAGHWAIASGLMTTPGERNQPLWLDVELPDRVRIEFTVRSDSESGDIKFECFGDGEHHESGYIFVMGGWNNSLSVLARRDEHEPDRRKRHDAVVSGRTYRMAVVRTTPSTVRWFVDGRLYLQYRDSEPLIGKGHRRFALNSWRAKLSFDDLKIYDLGAR